MFEILVPRASARGFLAEVVGRAHPGMKFAHSRRCRQLSSHRPGAGRRFLRLQYLLSQIYLHVVRLGSRWSSFRSPFLSAGKSKWPCLRVSSVAQSSSTRASATLALLVSIVVVLLSSVYHGCGLPRAGGATLEPRRETMPKEWLWVKVKAHRIRRGV
jgi:hypothetical protein